MSQRLDLAFCLPVLPNADDLVPTYLALFQIPISMLQTSRLLWLGLGMAFL